MESNEYKILSDVDGLIADWVCKGLNFDKNWLGNNITFGFCLGNKFIGGLIFHDIRPKQDVWWTVYSINKRWCNRRMLKKMFETAFQWLSCRRINILVDVDNKDSLNFVEKLGFKREGLLRSYRDDGKDCYLLGMLKDECKWI